MNNQTLTFLGLKHKFTRGVIWNIVSIIILAISGIFINIIIAKFYGPDALGVFNQVFSLFLIISQFSVLGIQFSVLKEVSYFQADLEKCNIIASSGLIIVAVISIFFSFITYLMSDILGAVFQSSGVAIGLRVISPGLFAFSLNKVLINILNGLNHMRSFAIFQSLRYFILMVCVIIFTFFHFSSDNLLGCITLTEFSLLIILLIYINLKIMKLSLKRIKIKYLISNLSFGSRGFIGGAFEEFKTRIDIIILGYFLNDTTVGIYSFAANLSEGFGQLSLVIRRNIDPLLGKYFATKDYVQMEKFTRKIRRTFFPLMILLGIISIVVYPIGLNLFIFDPVFDKSIVIFTILMTGIVLSSTYRPFSGILLQGGQPAMNTYMVGTLVLFQIALNIALIPVIGIYGAALASALTFIIEAGFIRLFSVKLFGLRL